MEILTSKNHLEFLAFLPSIKPTIVEWQLVTIKIVPSPSQTLSVNEVTDLLFSTFGDKDGRIYPVGQNEVLMLIREGIVSAPSVEILKKIEAAIPKGHCEVSIEKPTAENLSRLTVSIKFDEKEKLSESALKRRLRVENVILIADDDMYMRTLVKKGLNPRYDIHEVIHGSEIVAAYKKYVPDILFLDIHMPGKDGMENLEAILSFDPQAYVIMLSSDSSPENVMKTVKGGAKGFLAKPFSKDRLSEYVDKCPTLT